MFDTVGDGDVYLWRGANSPPVIWEFLAADIPDDQAATEDDLYDITGSEFYLRITRKGTTLVDLNTEDDPASFEIDIETARLKWLPTLADSRSLPLGRLCKYELERRIDGNQEPFAFGYVVVGGGLNDD